MSLFRLGPQPHSETPAPAAVSPTSVGAHGTTGTDATAAGFRRLYVSVSAKFTLAISRNEELGIGETIAAISRTDYAGRSS